MKEKEEDTSNKIAKAGDISRGLRKNRHADQNIQRPNYHKPENGHAAGIKKI